MFSNGQRHDRKGETFQGCFLKEQRQCVYFPKRDQTGKQVLELNVNFENIHALTGKHVNNFSNKSPPLYASPNK